MARTPAIALIQPAVQTLMLNLDQIEEDPDNARVTFDAERIKQRAESMRDVGQLQPIVVRLMPGGKYRLMDGALRFRAAPIAGLKTLRAELREVDDVQAALVAATANLQRENLTEYEEARAFQRMLDLSKKAGKPMTIADLARLRGIAHNSVKNRLKLLELGEEVGKRIGTNGFGAVHAQALEPLAKHPEHLAAVLKAVDDGAGVPTAGQMRSFVVGALERAKVAVNPTTQYSYSIRDAIPRFDQRVRELPHVELPDQYGRPDILVDQKVLEESVKKWQAEAREKAVKEQAKLAKAGKPKMPAKPKKTVGELLPWRLRDTQTELIAASCKGITKWDDDLQQALVGAFLSVAPALARKAEREALATASGLTEKEIDGMLRFGSSDAIAKIWPKKRLQVARLVAVMAAFVHRNHTPAGVQVLEAPFDVLFTGKPHTALKAKLEKEIREELAGGPKASDPAKDPPSLAPCIHCGKPTARRELDGTVLCARDRRGGPDDKKRKAAALVAKSKPEAKTTKKGKAKSSAKKPVTEPPAVAKARAKLAEKAKGKQAALPVENIGQVALEMAQSELLVDDGAKPSPFKAKANRAARRAAALAEAKAKPFHCLWGGCTERFVTQDEQQRHGVTCEYGMPDAPTADPLPPEMPAAEPEVQTS